MKGLLLHNFYSSVGNIKLFSILVAILGSVVLVTGNPTAQELFVYLAITALSINAVVSGRKDSISKWNKYEITLPLTRKSLVQCKYLSYLLWVTIGTILALAITMITMYIHGGSNLLYGMDNFYSMFAMGIGFSLLTGAFFYPVSYVTGIDKSETILIISILLSIGVVIVVLQTLNLFILSFAIRMGIFVAFYLILFVLSYVATLAIFRKAEF